MTKINKFLQLAKAVNRNITCKKEITDEKSKELILLCKKNNIPIENMNQDGGFDAYIFCWGLTPFDDHQGTLSIEFKCPLFHYFDFYYVSWDDFISLAKGTYKIKSLKEYTILLEEQDAPYIQSAILSFEQNFESLSKDPLCNMEIFM